jgi:HK97 family phage prohead protease
MTELMLKGELLSFDEDKRELYGLIVPFGEDAETARGLELFEAGAFDGVDPSKVVLRMRHQDPPTGRMVELEQKEDGAYGRFIVSKTAAGDEQLTLARDGVETGLSIGFEDGEFSKERVGDRIRFRHKTGRLSEVSTTWRPAYKAAAVLQTRERDDMAEEPNTGRAEAPTASQGISAEVQNIRDTLMTRIDQLEERQAAMNLMVPAPVEKQDTQRKVVLQLRELAEVITTDNSGVLPDTLSSEMLGRIATGRPFLNSTRQVPAPTAGTKLIFPKLTQTPIVGVQAAEKDELASRKTIITTDDYGMITIGGAGDLSMQLIRRSSPEFLGLWLELLGDAYATMAEDKAIDALLAETGVVEAGAGLDPSSPSFGEAFTNTATATGKTMKPDRIWLSTAAVVAFMDAKSPSGGGGTPLYPGLAGISGLQSGTGSSTDLSINLTPVWVPELDDETPDVIVGPSRGFVWAEDGTYTLQADVPAKFGRDVGLAGMIWYAPIYPAAFTSYVLES